MRKSATMLLIAMLTIMFVMAGCSQRESSSNTTTPKASESKPTDTKTDTKETTDTTKPATNDANTGGELKKVTVYSTTNDKPVQDVYKEIAEQFMLANPNIQVDLQFPGSEYENILKVKMAANDLPDIWDTHGWAVIRYGKYLADLRDESWTGQLTDTIKNVVTDKEGKVHALVLSEAKDGLTYNADLLAKYNIEPPSTFDELMAAADKLKKESNGEITPFYFSGIDDWMIGQFFDYFATSLLISPQQNEAQNLLDNKMDWSKWDVLPQKFLEIYKKGYMNKDVLTAKYSDLSSLFAQGKIAFSLLGPSFADEVHKIKPDLKIGFMPVPSMVAGDTPNFSGGERLTMGAWKDSKNLPEAKKVIEYFAKPENMTKFANVTKLPPGLKGVTANHEFTEYYDKYASIRVFPYFDRVYLPNGMWDVMCKTGTALLANQVTPQQFSAKMKQEVERLLNK
ncbi:binding protein msmE [Paenibacillus selenitireducens]|uniref:Binding protein msmE n=1 Tax=Paenibacillus selenitireducens TaxID=1324314 RepID=A0A1T2XME2_9BACL|nr:extracellular solute-binding protein [Paenibacillus selenitireducens]OPA81050.1 binding protein msmE [Paenibacillus selenitireducens]